MSVRIQLQRPHTSFTNLDEVRGKVFLSITSQETIAAIQVKLEGESGTRLAGVYVRPGYSDYHQRDQTQLEVHKLLYKVQTVFPTPEVMRASSKSQYTLPPGQYEYPFNFKIPFNNDCVRNNSLLANLSAMRMEQVRGANAHVKKTLPPTLSGLPGEAEIRYYVKVTVQRPAFFKENFRAFTNFMFFPIEPPRPPPNRRESFARLTHRFTPSIGLAGKPGMFRQPSGLEPDQQVTPPEVRIDCRLPDPAIITCNESLPLRILVENINGGPSIIYLQSVNVLLVAWTKIRAHELQRVEESTWTIISASNMRLPLTKQITREEGKIFEVDPMLWKNLPLPSTVSPSFETCNVGRKYELFIQVGLSWGVGPNVNPELAVYPIHMPVDVFSGVAPPEALLAAMAGRPDHQHPPEQVPGPLPPRPPTASGGLPIYSGPTTQLGRNDHIEPSPSDIPDEAPPSYEDAVADEIGPIDGARRDYQQNPSVDMKGERLFPESGP